MTDRINHAFASGKAVIPFVTGGDPDLETTKQLLYALSEAGTDLIEIGVPFSDPIAEGPVIEAADQRALENGCTLDNLMDLVAEVRQDLDLPIVLVTYYNPVYVYGVDRFAARATACGIDGLIVPDLPFDERDELNQPCLANGIVLISLVAANSPTRIAEIAEDSTGFLYCVAPPGDTFHDIARSIIQCAHQASQIRCAIAIDNPTPDQAHQILGYADGLIISTAIVEIIAQYGSNCLLPVTQYMRSLPLD